MFSKFSAISEYPITYYYCLLVVEKATVKSKQDSTIMYEALQARADTHCHKSLCGKRRAKN